MKFLKILLLSPFIILFLGLFIVHDSYAATFADVFATATLDETTQDFYAQNNILFYDPSCNSASGTMSSSFKVDPTVNPWYPEGDLIRTYAGGISGSALTYWSASSAPEGNKELYRSTQDDDEMGGMQYVYAEQYDVSWNGNSPVFTKNGSGSTTKYYWVVLPDKAYGNAAGEMYLATFEKIKEPIHLILLDVHACQHQHDPNYCEQAATDPNSVVGGKNLLGALTNQNGNSTALYDFTGGITGLHRLKGDSQILVPESGSGSGSSASDVTVNTDSSAITWTDGWISSGMEGYKMEDARQVSKDSNWQQDYSTNGKPNKILLHATEGTTSGLAAYGSNLYPAHFTIDLKNKNVSQHFPIDKPSVATKGGDLGGAVQIEIVGFGLDSQGKCTQDGDDYCFDKFGDGEWDYLANLLYGIQQWGKNNSADIPLATSVDWDLGKGDSIRIQTTDSYEKTTGIVGHMHSPKDDHTDPGNIWSMVEAAIQRHSNNNVCDDSGAGGDFASMVKKYAWPDYHPPVFDTDMPDYKEAAEKHRSEGKYIGASGQNSGDPGVDCGGFVTILVQDSKLDENYNSGNGNTISQWDYLKNNWEPLTNSISESIDTSLLQPGDVAISSGHTFIYVGDIPDFNSNRASASLSERAPMAGTESLTSGMQWYRKKGK